MTSTAAWCLVPHVCPPLADVGPLIRQLLPFHSLDFFGAVFCLIRFGKSLAAGQLNA
jgi:hypothetical protein